MKVYSSRLWKWEGKKKRWRSEKRNQRRESNGQQFNPFRSPEERTIRRWGRGALPQAPSASIHQERRPPRFSSRARSHTLARSTSSRPQDCHHAESPAFPPTRPNRAARPVFLTLKNACLLLWEMYAFIEKKNQGMRRRRRPNNLVLTALYSGQKRGRKPTRGKGGVGKNGERESYLLLPGTEGDAGEERNALIAAARPSLPNWFLP